MKQLIRFVFAVFFLCAGAAWATEAAQSLGLGELTSIPVEAGTRFSVGNSDVIQVKTTQIAGGRSLLLVKGKSQGYSDLILLGEKGERRTMPFRVVSKRQAALAGDGKAIFSPASGLSLQTSGDGWLARGSARSLDDWNAERSLEAQGKGKVQSIAHLHPLERIRAESRIRRLLRDAGVSGVEVKSAGSTVLLFGDATSAAEKDLAESLAQEVIRDVRSQIRVPFEKGARLRFQARILEVLKDSALSLGLQWPDGVPNALQISNNFAKAGFSLDANLKLLERKGQARLLAQPQLLLNEKGVAELQVGGQIPIPLHSHLFSAVEWKQYGLSLKLELPGVSRNLARTHVIVEISTLDPANGADGVPALRLSKLDTQVDMELGKAVLLSGLMESRQSRNTAGLPFLSDIPVLGELFRSHDFQENRSELVILLEATP
ncbi:MAG: BON domain-containing protein [Bdellovibrionota bacterium]